MKSQSSFGISGLDSGTSEKTLGMLAVEASRSAHMSKSSRLCATAFIRQYEEKPVDIGDSRHSIFTMDLKREEVQ